MNRVVSLIASGTEIVCALGLEDQVVGRSHECDFPPSVKGLPVCTRPNFATDGTSHEIDQRVKATLQAALSVYRVDTDLLREFRPSHIITQAQCEVCAVSLKEVEQAVCDLTDTNPTIVSLQPKGLADVWADIQRVAQALGVPERGHQLIRKLQNQMACISEKTQPLRMRPRVACIEWIDPLMVAGNWMPELVEMAGGMNLFGEAGKHSPWVTWEDIQKSDPDVILILPCGFDIQRTRKERRSLTQKPGWSDLKAVRGGRVYVTDGNQYFNRPGPRLADSLEILGEILHPELFRFGHEGVNWQEL
ncbi:MAG: cobalamin-binding protein [Nitrospira sp.]|nr:cobalamin-binding protein [Nitrospira sp.]